MPPSSDWPDWLWWDCIGAGILGKVLGLWFGFCVSLPRKLAALVVRNEKRPPQVVMAPKSWQDGGLYVVYVGRLERGHLETGLDDCGRWAGSSPDGDPDLCKRSLADLLGVDLVFKAEAPQPVCQPPDACATLLHIKQSKSNMSCC